jgi:F-type H+-transporting ATPase subunit alpha
MNKKDLPLVEIKDTGTITEIKKGIVNIKGLSSCRVGQLIKLRPDLMGMVIGFDKDKTSAFILGDEHKINIGNVVYGHEDTFTVPVGDDLRGRILDIFGRPRDGKGRISESDRYPIFRNAPGVMDREPVIEPLFTGISIIDTLIPIGKGQRELIVGDRVTGKTSLVIDTILNQKGKGITCIFCWIGGSYSSLAKIIEDLKRQGAMDYTIIVSALASDSPAEQYLAPYAAAAMGEYFMYNNKDSMVAFDNLTRHAWIWRQLSLLLERPPGREAYPGDIFFLHSQLIERAAKLNSESGGGSMTFFPIVETQKGDITGLIPSNLVSMTDGQIYLNTSLFKEGFIPAIDIGLSVSRIGNKVQPEALKEVSRPLKREYAQYKELLELVKIRTKLSPEIEFKIKKGNALRDLLIQDRSSPLSLEEEVIFFYAFGQEIPEILDDQKRKKFKEDIYDYLKNQHPEILEEIRNQKVLNENIKRNLFKAIEDFFRQE